MRTQLARPNERLLSPEAYDQLFSMHGVTMIFLFVTPMLSGFGNYFVPLMIGARDMAFPRLNALGYWVFLGVGLFIYSSLVIGSAPDDGWFSYAPLSMAPGSNIDFYGLGLIFLGISTTAGAINFIVTIIRLRAPGMSLNRMPLFCWAMLATSLSLVFAVPSLTADCLLLELSRKWGYHFFDSAHGGDALLWQHLFWIFGHPDVYIIFLPAVGIVSTIIPVFSRRPMVAQHLRRARDDGDRVPRLRRLGAPHVRRRAAAADDDVLRGGEHGDRDPERDSDLRLARDDHRRPAGPARRRSCSSSASSSCS